MSNPVLVRGYPDNWWFLLGRIVGFIGLSLGAYRVVHQQPGGGVLLIAGGVIVAAVEIVAAHGGRRSLWVEDLGHGFRLSDRRGSREIRDQQVSAASLETREHFKEGLAESVTQRLSLWIDSEPQLLVMTTRTRVTTTNPLGDLWTRLFTGLKERAESAFERGETITGAGWRLRPDGFELDIRGASEQFRLEDFTAIYVIQQRLCLWTHADRPTIRIPIGSRNAQILRLLLEPGIQQRLKAEVPGGDGLGRILYEHRTGIGNLAGLAVLAAAAGGLGVFLFWSLGQRFLGGLALTFAGLLTLSFVHHLATVFRWHHFGVSQRGLLGWRQFHFNEVYGFQCAMSQAFYQGSYSHIDYRFEFHPHPNATAQPILFIASVRNASDDGLSKLADHLNERVGHQMALRLNAGERVRWTRDLSFLPEGLECREQSSGKLVTVPYEAIQIDSLLKGVVYAEQNRQLTLLHVLPPSNVQNFAPGFLLLEKILSSRASPTGSSGQQPDTHVS